MRSPLQFTGEAPWRESVNRVLLLEDNPADADLTRERLTDLPGHEFAVSHVSTLEAGIAALTATDDAFDVVIIDLDLPDSSGIETLTRMRAVAADLPIVVFSGRSERRLAEELLAAGADEVLHKNEPASRMLARTVLASLDRLRAEARHRRMEQLVLQSPDGVLVTDRAGRVLFANAAAQQLFGKPEAQLVGQSLGFAFEDGQTFEIDVTRAGDQRAAELRVVACRWQDTDGFLATIRDVTERNRMAEVLRHRQKLEAIGQLAGGVAHDFNNLLTVIMTRADFAGDHAEPDSELFQHIDGIRRASQRAATLTRQLLTFARRQSGEAVVIDINEVVRNWQKLVGRVIGEHIQVEMRFDPDVPHICADPDQIGQALTNLSLNARDAMPTGGRLTVSTARCELGTAAAAELGLAAGVYARLSVRDTGHGMVADVRERIFEPFFTTKKDHGTGLGLAMVHGIVTQAGGRIRVESAPGQGSTFELFLPRAAGAGLAASTPATQEKLTGHERVLLVEDEPDVRDVTASLLQRFGYVVTSTPDAVSALDAFRAAITPFDLVLTDIVMPGMSGWELFERVRAESATQRVLFMSGYSDEVLADHGVVKSSIPLLAKPFTSNELARAVRRTLDGHDRP